MIYDIFQILLWITAIMLFISGVDDLYLDLLYWFEKGNYKRKLPDFSEMFEKPEKPIAVFIGAWKESGVIGRTLSYAVKNLKYENYRFFLGVYPNDPETLKVVQEISKKDSRVIPCINNVNGPTTKADNLNLLYAGLIEYEKQYGKFEIILVQDAEDFMHPNSLKLYNLLLGYKGYHAIQIPVIPIKSKLGGLFHRTYCDAFAEVHTKDMIVRQAMGTFIPFAGTGMGFHRKTFNYLEKHYHEKLNGKIENYQNDFILQNDDSKINEIYENKTNYLDDPFKALNFEENKSIKNYLKSYTFLFLILIISWISIIIYTGNEKIENLMPDNRNNLNLFSKELNAKNSISENLYKKYDISNLATELNEIVMVSNGYWDIKYNVLYIENKNKFDIVESTWTDSLFAKKRINELNNLNILLNKQIFTQIVEHNNKNVYQIIISNYDKIIDARNDIEKIRKNI